MKAITTIQNETLNQAANLNKALSQAKSTINLLRRYFHITSNGNGATVSDDILAYTQWNAETLLDTARSTFDEMPITDNTPTDELSQHLLQASGILKLLAWEMETASAHDYRIAKNAADLLWNIETLIIKAEHLILNTKEWQEGGDEASTLCA